MDGRRRNERDDSLHSCRWDLHICMAICPVEVVSHRGDGDIWASIFRFLSEFGFLMKHIINRFCSGVYVSIVTKPIMDMGETGDVGRRTGMFFSILAIGALTGPPISGAIKSATGDFKAVGYYAGGPLKFNVFVTNSDPLRNSLGTAVLVGIAMMSVSRHLILRRMFGKI